MKTLKVYVSSRIKDQAEYDRISETLSTLAYEDVFYLRPQLGSESSRAYSAKFDFKMIHQADEIWVVNQFGMDCMFEIGYAIGIGKPVTIFVTPDNEEKVKSQWMIYGCPIKLVQVKDLLK